MFPRIGTPLPKIKGIDRAIPPWLRRGDSSVEPEPVPETETEGDATSQWFTELNKFRTDSGLDPIPSIPVPGALAPRIAQQRLSTTPPETYRVAEPTPLTPFTEQTFKELERFTGDIRPPMDEEGYLTLRNVYGEQVRGPDFAGEIKRATERHQAEEKIQKQQEKTERWMVTQPDYIQDNVNLALLYEKNKLPRPSNLTPLPTNPTAADWERLNKDLWMGLDNALRVKDIPVQDPVGEFMQLTEASGEVLGTGLEMGTKRAVSRAPSGRPSPVLSDRAQKSRDAIVELLEGKKSFGETVDFLSENMADRPVWQQLILMGLEPVGLVATGAGWGKALQTITRSGMTAKQVRAARFDDLVKRYRRSHRGAVGPTEQATRMAESELMDPVSLASKYAVKRIDEARVKNIEATRKEVRRKSIHGEVGVDRDILPALDPEDIRISDEAFAARAADEVVPTARAAEAVVPVTRAADEGPQIGQSITEQFSEGLNARSQFEGGEVTPRLGYAWRSMGPKEYEDIIAGKPFGGSPAKRGKYWSWFPSYSSNLTGTPKRTKYLVEVEIQAGGGEALSRIGDLSDVRAVWKSERKGVWTPEPFPRKVAEAPITTARAADDVIQRTPGTQMVRQADGTLKEITPPELNLQVLEEGKVGKQLGGIQLENLAPLPQQIGRNILEGIQSKAEFVGRPVMKALGREVPEISRAERRRRARELKGSWVNKYGSFEEKEVAHKLIRALEDADITGKTRLRRLAEIVTTRKQRQARGYQEAAKARREGGRGIDEIRAAKSALAGQLSDTTLDPAKFREILTDGGKSPNAIDTLLNIVEDKITAFAPGQPRPGRLRYFDTINASDGLRALLERGVIPQPHITRILTDILGPGVGKAIRKREPRTVFGKFTTGLHELINAPRALKASFDISFLGRQAGMMLPGEAVKAASAANIAVRAFAPGGEDVAVELIQAMRAADNGRMWNMIVDKGGVFISDVVTGVDTSLTNREEAFMGSFMGKSIPYVRGSERAHATFLAKFRWDLMDDYLKRIETEMGRPLLDEKALKTLRPELSPVQTSEIMILDERLVKAHGDYINAMTGRGPLTPSGSSPGVEAALQSILNGLLFSPKLFTSRIAAPIYAARLMTPGMKLRKLPWNNKESFYKLALQNDGEARAVYKEISKMVARQLVGWYMTGMTTYWLAKQASDFMPEPVQEVGRRIPVPELPTVEGMRGMISGLRVGGDPVATDFGKIIFEGPGGQRTYDIWAGNAQIARAIGQLIEGRAKSSRTGMEYEVSIPEVAKRLVRSKFNPTAGMFLEYNLLPGVTDGENWGKGTGFLGEDRDLLKDIKAPLWKDGGPNEQSFWIRLGEPLFIRELMDSIDSELTPVLPGTDQVLWNKNTPSLSSKRNTEPWGWDKVQDIVTGAATALPAAGGIGFGAYVTPDQITREMTKRDFGVELNYIDVPKFYREEVNEQLQQEELAKGVTREFSLAGRINKIDGEEEEAYRKLAGQPWTGRETRSAYRNISEEFNEQRQAEYAKEGFADDESEKSKALRKEGLSKVELYAKQITEEANKQIEQLTGVTGGIPDDAISNIYETITRSYETSSDPHRRAALVWYLMDRYRVTIPENLLNRLHVSIWKDYNNSKKYREMYRSGELRRHHPVLYAPR